METLLTIAETANLLNCSSGFVRKRIALAESNQPGGWPKSVYVNLQPNGVKSLFRVKQQALNEYLQGTTSADTMEEASAACEVE
jgi:hypothetical protein